MGGTQSTHASDSEGETFKTAHTTHAFSVPHVTAASQSSLSVRDEQDTAQHAGLQSMDTATPTRRRTAWKPSITLRTVSALLVQGENVHEVFTRWASPILQYFATTRPRFIIHMGVNKDVDALPETMLQDLQELVPTVIDNDVDHPLWDYSRELGKGAYGAVLCDAPSKCADVWKIQTVCDVSDTSKTRDAWVDDLQRSLLSAVLHEVRITCFLAAQNLAVPVNEVHVMPGVYTAMRLPRLTIDLAALAAILWDKHQNTPITASENGNSTAMRPELLLCAALLRAFEKLWMAWFNAGVFVGDCSAFNVMIGWDDNLQQWDVYLIDHGGSWLQTDKIQHHNAQSMVEALMRDDSKFFQELHRLAQLVFYDLESNYDLRAIHDPMRRGWVALAAQALCRTASIFRFSSVGKAIVRAVTHSCQDADPSDHMTLARFANGFLLQSNQLYLHELLQSKVDISAGGKPNDGLRENIALSRENFSALQQKATDNPGLQVRYYTHHGEVTNSQKMFGTLTLAE